MRNTAVAVLVAGTTALGAPAAAGPPVEGVWQTDGYGQILAIHHGNTQSYERTLISCLPAQTDGDVRGRTLRFAGSPGHISLRRLNHLPSACTEPAPNDPRAKFDIFWHTFAENYPFFRQKGMDWTAVGERYGRRINSDADLYSAFCSMVLPLHDGHIYVQHGNQFCATGRPGTETPGPELDSRTTKFIVENDLHGRSFRTFANGRIGYADLPGKRGYLRISGFGGYAGDDSFAANSTALRHALDAVLTTPRVESLRGLIIDVRVNGGGYDQLGLQVAGRLTNRPYVAYRKVARNGGTLLQPAFTRPQPIHVRPAAAPRYTGPIAVLTSGSTVSAGETFVQALMGRTRTIRIGQNTQGVFSDVLERSLPGGLNFGLPNEEFRTAEGKTFDGTGIPPQIRTPVFTEQEFRSGHDLAFSTSERILDHLDSGAKTSWYTTESKPRGETRGKR